LKNNFIITLLLILGCGEVFFSQEKEGLDLGNISGNTQIIAQYYNEDTLINAALPDHIMGMNSFTNINYTRGDFRAGIRYETYLNPLEGYPSGFSGSGIGYRFASWKNEKIDITVGNFFEQFGSGMILRAYEEPNLGLNNGLDGIKVKYEPYKGISLTGLIGQQRVAFDNGFQNGNGIVRGFDGEIDLNTLFDSTLADSKFRISIGGSFVSKYNNDNNTPDFILPKNVGSYGGRIAMRYGKLRFSGEYILKENDPYPNTSDERFNYIYTNGEGILLNLGYSTKGFGIDLSAKHNDNILWRSTNASVAPTSLLIGYLPTMTKQHTYNLASTMYPYATNPLGEIAFQTDIIFKIPKKTAIGGKYGTSVNINFATAYAPKRTYLNDMNSSRRAYTTKPFNAIDSAFVKDFNIEIKRKFSKKFKASLTYFNFVFDDRAILVAQNHELIYAQIFVAEATYKINKHHSLRLEAQHLGTKQDRGNWAYGLIEYSISPHWFLAVMDQYNYGNPSELQQLHYALATAGYLQGPHRFSIQYGRQRAGVFCVGGVCRAVPASNGVTFTLTTSF
jgi:hypothetical protein